MSPTDTAVSAHYTIPNLGEALLERLEAAGKDLGSLDVDDLAVFDEFHIRGRAATEELAQLAGIQADEHVLDVGCGIGGTSRYLASRHDARVTGIDLTPEYCRTATLFSQVTGMSSRTRFRQASALAIPFEDASFDVALTEHVQMNIADKRTFYAELGRVTRPGGRIVFHDIVAGDGSGLHFPVPWSAGPETSHLADEECIRGHLDTLDLEVESWVDRSADSIEFFRSALARFAAEGWPHLGLHSLMGDDHEAKFENVLCNLVEGRIRVIQARLCPRAS
jgi:SAM-dependent methyltransferase